MTVLQQLDWRLSSVIPDIVELVKAVGGTTYVVGGAVRDIIRLAYNQENTSITFKDVDVLVTGVDYDVLMSLLKTKGTVDIVGKSFGVLIFTRHEKYSANQMPIEIALPRTERSIGVGHKDFIVNYDKDIPVEQDLARRDFKMNAIAYDIVNKKIIDPFNGLQDIENKKITCVGNTADRFEEDALRMVRAIQFSVRFNMKLSVEIFDYINANVEKLNSIPAERFKGEFNKVWNTRTYYIRLNDTIPYELKPINASEQFINILNNFGISELLFGKKVQYFDKLTTYHGDHIGILGFIGNKDIDLSRINPTNEELRYLFVVESLLNNVPPYLIFKSKAEKRKILDRELIKLGLDEEYFNYIVEMPSVASELAIKGEEFMTIGFEGKQIGDLQKEILKNIHEGTLNPHRYTILKYIKEKYILTKDQK